MEIVIGVLVILLLGSIGYGYDLQKKNNELEYDNYTLEWEVDKAKEVRDLYQRKYNDIVERIKPKEDEKYNFIVERNVNNQVVVDKIENCVGYTADFYTVRFNKDKNNNEFVDYRREDIISIESELVE